MGGNTYEILVGRLLEIRLGAGFERVNDVDEMVAALNGQFAKLKRNEKVAITADWRAVQVMNPEAAVRVRKMFSVVNRRVMRSAILTLPKHPTMSLQIARLIREAQNAERRHFTSTEEHYRWLSEVLTPEESARLKVFLELTTPVPKQRTMPVSKQR